MKRNTFIGYALFDRFGVASGSRTHLQYYRDGANGEVL